jgi:hypothetical protein
VSGHGRERQPAAEQEGRGCAAGKWVLGHDGLE